MKASQEQIYFESIKNALFRLEDALLQPMDEYRRDGVIQRFKYTFELSWKFMKRVLKKEGIDASSPMQVFREANSAKLIDNFEYWVELLRQRNLSSHTYNQATAEEVFQTATSFPPRVRNLINTLETRVNL